MDSPKEPLLRTKLFVPPIRSRRVARARLIERINHNLDKALILVSAPAGFGKTTLLAEWESQAALPVAWLSLDAGDNDPNRFLRYIITAINTAFAEQGGMLCATTQAMLQASQPISIQAILVTLLNEWVDIAEPFSLVLDDYQAITSQGVNEVLAFILERLPSHAHLIVSTRVDPSIPLHRLRASQRLFEIRTDLLRFRGEEANDFINGVMELNMNNEEIAALAARTEGWIVGLQMASLSMQGMADRAAFIHTLSGTHRYILEYLIEEVLDRQPEYLRDFLLQTAILDRLCAPLCAAVLEDQLNCQDILQHLYHSNLFLTPLDEVGTWYRYHHLFADLLRALLQRFQPEKVPVLHLRASQWYENAGLSEAAIQHALTAKDFARAAQLVENSAVDLMSRGEMSTLLSLYEALPEDLIASRPALGVYQAWVQTFTGQIAKVDPQLREIEKQILKDAALEANAIRGSIAILRGLLADFQGDMPAAIELARQADGLLPAGNLVERSIIPFVLGDGYFATGELENAGQAFEQIKKIGLASGNLWTVAVALNKLALMKKLQGKLNAMEALYREAIRFASERGGQHYGSMGAAYVGLSDLLREKNDLDAARQMVVQAIDSMKNWHSPTDLVNGYITLARILIAQGDIEAAQEALDQAGEISSQGNIFPITSLTLESCQVRLWLMKGEQARVSQWIERKGLTNMSFAPDHLDPVNELEYLTFARVLVARSESDRAISILSALAEAEEDGGRNTRLIECLILTALALFYSGEKNSALDVLGKSLALADPEGFMRIFLDEGKDVIILLYDLSKRAESAVKGYADRLLAACAARPVDQPGAPGPRLQPESLVERLTEREAEVLHLLAAGLSNQEIAKKLVLSAGTIKTHTHNLYSKLGVQSRTQAIARAKELNLLS